MRDFVKYKIKANHIFISGLLVIPPFIFQQSTAVKWGQVFLFVLSAYLTGKKIRVIPNIIMISGIIFANLLTPVGEVLFEYGWFIITGAALKSGLEKSALLIGMIYLSKFTLSGGFSSPGNKSNILSLVFYYFEKNHGRGKKS